jgi:hypothetical protein
MNRWLALAFVLAALPSTAATATYNFVWRSTATVSRVEHGDTVTRRGEMNGTGTLVLSQGDGGLLIFEFDGPGGSGRGTVGLGAVEAMTFPTPPEAGIPPSPPHPAGGRFAFEGDPASPTRFALTYVEAFICRAESQACENVMMWERTFQGTATLARVKTRHEGIGARLVAADAP